LLGDTQYPFFPRKLSRRAVWLLAILEKGAAEQEIIYILEEFTQREMEGEEVPS
jgi:hypothetical protein